MTTPTRDTLASLIPAGHVLRLCAAHSRLPTQDCAIPGRCVRETCRRCSQDVHYDPGASIPALGPEFILCDACFDEVA